MGQNIVGLNNMTIFLITHTETYYNRQRIFCGKRDSRLTPLGHRQAEAIGRKLKKEKIDIVFTSPLGRCLQTLKHIKKYHLDIKIIKDKRLSERDYGRLTGKSKVKYRRQYPELYQIYHRSYESPPPGGESIRRVEKRVLKFLKSALRQIKRDKLNALIIGHNNSVRPIRRYFEKLPIKRMMQEDNHLRIFIYSVRS